MKLLQCYVENFGKLHQFSLQFNAGYNVFCYENGWGKTTLITFIKAMFYGLSNYRGSDLEQNERKKYLPWQGGNFGGNLDFEYQGKTYRVTRFFGKTNAADTFTLTDLATGKPSKDYKTNLGETIFDLDAASFMRTLLIPQVDVESVTTAQINDRLVNLIQGTNEQSHYATAIKILDDKRRGLSTQMKTGQIEKTQAALMNNAMRMDELRRQVAQADNLPAQITAADHEIAKLQKRQATVQQQIGAHAVLQNLPTDGKSQVKLPSSAKQKTLALMSIVFGVGAVVGIFIWLLGVSGIINLLFRWGIVILSLLMLAGCLVCLMLYLAPWRRQVMATAKSTTANTALAALQAEQDHLQAQITAQLNLKMSATVAYQNAQNLENELVELEREHTELNLALQNLQTELKAVQAAQDFIMTAYENLNTKYLQPMQDGLQKYLHILTKQDFSQMTVDTDLNLSMPAYGQNYSTAYYSRGYQNLFDLCLRLALVDALFADQEPPLLIMDDPFVNLDADKIAAARKFLNTLAQDRQIIYFTCHASRA